ATVRRPVPLVPRRRRRASQLTRSIRLLLPHFRTITMTSAIPMDLALFFVATLLGAVVAGVAGFAFGLIASAVWLHIIPPTQSAPLIAAFAILIQGATLWKLRHALQISRLLPFIAGGAIGIPLGAAALNWTSPDQMRAFIGVVLIIFSLYSLARPALPPVKG